MNSSPSLACSLVIPFFNEEESVEAVISEACQTMRDLGLSHEIIAVDDGSNDATRRLAQAMTAQWPQLRVLAYGKNRGQAAALLDGLRQAHGEILITMDGDGQNDPADIPAMLQLLNTTGASMVSGVRTNRKDSWLRHRMSRLANAVRQKILHDGITDSGCAIKAFHKEVLSSLIPIRTLYSFIPALAVAGGFRVVEINVNHRLRKTGTSKYGIGVMLWRPMVDMMGIYWFISRRFPELEAISTYFPQ